MAEVLLQHEIDSLIDSLAKGEFNPEELAAASEAKVKSYNFHRPNKFSKEQLRTLQGIHGNFARLLSNFLSAYLRSHIRVNVTSVQQLTYEDFVRSIPSPTLITVFGLQPLKRTGVFETNMQFVFPVLDLLFGGKAWGYAKTRELTEIEVSVLRKLNAKILEQLATAWSGITEIKTSIEAMENNPRFSQTITPNETVAVITFDSFIGTTKGLINLCIPYVALDPVLSKLSSHYWLADGVSRKDLYEVQRIENVLSKIKINLSVLVGETEVSVGDFLQLQEGDVIQLNRSVSEDMDLFVDNRLKFKVKPGRVGKKLAAQVISVVEGE